MNRMIRTHVKKVGTLLLARTVLSQPHIAEPVDNVRTGETGIARFAASARMASAFHMAAVAMCIPWGMSC